MRAEEVPEHTLLSRSWWIPLPDFDELKDHTASSPISLISDLSNNSSFAITMCPDTDLDGIPDSLDLDSDGDGCNDVLESGGTDGGALTDADKLKQLEFFNLATKRQLG